MILGLDISSSCTGVVLLNSEQKYIFSGIIDYGPACNVPSIKKKEKILLSEQSKNLTKKEFNKYLNRIIFYRKLEYTEKYLKELFFKYNITKIFVEAPLSGFTNGRTTASTKVALEKINEMTCYICYKEIGIFPRRIDVQKARKALGIKHNKKTENIKEVIYNYVKNNEPLFGDVLNSKNEFNTKTYDKTDAYVIVKSSFILF